MKKRREAQKRILNNLLANKPEARKVENRYRAIRYVLGNYFPQLFKTYPPETIEQLLRDIVYLDRQVRLATEGVDDEKKQILSQSYQIDVLEREPGYHEVVKQLALRTN